MGKKYTQLQALASEEEIELETTDSSTRTDAVTPQPEPEPQESSKRKFTNVLICGIAYSFLFASVNTGLSLESTVLTNQLGQPHLSFYALTCLYVSFSITSIFVASIQQRLGLKYAMVLGGVGLTALIIALIYPMTPVIIIANMINGAARSVLWISQALFVAHNSDPATAVWSQGIFWMLSEGSAITGGFMEYYVLPSGPDVTPEISRKFYIILTATGLTSASLLLFLRSKKNELVKQTTSNMEYFKQTFGRVYSREMLSYIPWLLYCGCTLQLWILKYPTVIGGDISPGPTLPPAFSPRTIGLNGIFSGLGEVIGAPLSGPVGDRWGRVGLTLLNLVNGIVLVVLLYVNFCSGWIEPNLPLALFCSVLIGMADCFNNILQYVILRDCRTYDHVKGAQTYTLFKFFHPAFTALAASYTSYLEFTWQVLLIAIFLVVGSWLLIDGAAKYSTQPAHERASRESEDLSTSALLHVSDADEAEEET